MKAKHLRHRKCSVLLAAGAGAAVCLSQPHAAVSSGAVNNSFAKSVPFGVFDNEINISVYTFTSGLIGLQLLGGTSNTAFFHGDGGGSNTVIFKAADADVSTLAFPGQTVNIPYGFPASPYLGLKFTIDGAAGTYYYGWIEIANATATKLHVGEWGWNNSPGANIKTLADSLTTTKLPLATGLTRLHWTNDNEDGVARYEVQSKDASGAWQAIDSDTPGEGRYTATVAKDAECRLVVEKVDGQSEEVQF